MPCYLRFELGALAVVDCLQRRSFMWGRICPVIRTNVSRQSQLEFPSAFHFIRVRIATGAIEICWSLGDSATFERKRISCLDQWGVIHREDDFFFFFLKEMRYADFISRLMCHPLIGLKRESASHLRAVVLYLTFGGK